MKIVKVKKIQVVVGEGSNTEFKRFIDPSKLKEFKKHYSQYKDTVRKTGATKYVRRLKIK